MPFTTHIINYCHKTHDVSERFSLNSEKTNRTNDNVVMIKFSTTGVNHGLDCSIVVPCHSERQLIISTTDMYVVNGE